MKSILFVLFLYIGTILLWIFNILIPFGSKILTHIQNHANLNTQLDLLYCGKQVLLGIMWTFLLSLCVWLISLFVVVRNK